MRLHVVRSHLGLVVLGLLALTLVACDSGGGGGGEPMATNISVSPPYLSFDGTSQATVTVTANGRWSLSSSAAWLETSRGSGSAGTTTVTVTVDRSGLAPQQYAGELAFSGADELASITVSMRFPTVTGHVTNSEKLILPTSVGDGAASLPASATNVIPGEYLVVLDAGMARVLEAGVNAASLATVEPSMATFEAMASSLATDYGVAAGEVVSRELPFFVVSGASEEDAARLAADGRVRSVSPNRLLYAPPVTASPADVDHSFGLQWHYEDIQLSNAWNITQGDEDVVVAVIDTGFAYWHPDLAPNYLGGYDFAYDLPTPDAASDTCALHGTHVAGTVAAVASDYLTTTSGVAPGVKLRLFRTGREEAGCPMPTDAIIAAVLHAAGYEVGDLPQIDPVDVINLSLGGYAYDAVFEAAVALAVDAGVVVVAATGNDDTTPVAYPAGYQGVIGVGATDYLQQRAPYSNYGQDVDVVAPGGDLTVDRNGDGLPDGVLSLYWNFVHDAPDYTFLQGTSMASPHVAGVAALIRSVNPDLPPLLVELVLKATAKDLGTTGPDTWYGWGLVDAGAAVAVARALEVAPSFSDVIMRLRSGATVVRQVNAGASGAYDLGQVAAGTYTLEAGTDMDGDGDIDDFGEFHASVPVTVTYEGDVVRDVDVELGVPLQLAGAGLSNRAHPPGAGLAVDLGSHAGV